MKNYIKIFSTIYFIISFIFIVIFTYDFGKNVYSILGLDGIIRTKYYYIINIILMISNISIIYFILKSKYTTIIIIILFILVLNDLFNIVKPLYLNIMNIPVQLTDPADRFVYNQTHNWIRNIFIINILLKVKICIIYLINKKNIKNSMIK